MTVLIEGSKSFFLASNASLILDDREAAWAERTVKPNPAVKYVLGKFVEANRANNNKQFWALDQLRMAQPSITHSPMNMLHGPRIVGTWIDTEMMYPVNENAAEDDNPFIEALGVFWKWYFPTEFKMIEAAHAMNTLHLSMECVSESITCAGENGCGETFPYEGPRSVHYCAHLNGAQSTKQLNNPHFLGGALIIPPEKPGWSGANVSDLSSLVNEHRLEAELAYEGFKAGSPDLGPAHWEYLMGALLKHANDTAARHKVGTHARLTHQVGHFPPGTTGQVVSAHNGPYYGMMMGGAGGGVIGAAGNGPVYYCPEPDMMPNDTPPDGPSGAYAKAEPSVAVREQIGSLVDSARKFSADQRKKAADSGVAMMDGSFPIKNAGDLKNAIRLAGNAKDPAAAKRHIKARAKALGLENMIPDTW